jgi:hypothetical protein
VRPLDLLFRPEVDLSPTRREVQPTQPNSVLDLAFALIKAIFLSTIAIFQRKLSSNRASDLRCKKTAMANPGKVL